MTPTPAMISSPCVICQQIREQAFCSNTGFLGFNNLYVRSEAHQYQHIGYTSQDTCEYLNIRHETVSIFKSSSNSDKMSFCVIMHSLLLLPCYKICYPLIMGWLFCDLKVTEWKEAVVKMTVSFSVDLFLYYVFPFSNRYKGTEVILL